ncbi:prephenate dehydratase [Streptococcus pneumoniae]|nr:prephenate dehydratase [Streptococcus pneumoniae]
MDYSVVPVENSIEGSVHETLDYLFHQAHIQAVAEIVQPIHQQLMVVPGHTKIEKIFSHPQALAQGKKFIDEQYPEAQIEEELEAIGIQYKILGAYPIYPISDHGKERR